MRAARRTYGFKKPGWTQLLVLIFFVPFVAVGLGAGAVIFETWRTARDLASYDRPPMGAALGRVRVQGRVTRAKPVVSPLGVEGVGWVGAVLHVMKDSEGVPRLEPVCVRADLSELGVQVFMSEWSLTLARPDEPVVLGRRSKLVDPLPIVDIGDPGGPDPPGTVPDVIRRACAGELASAVGPVAYHEAVLAKDTPVEVLGCAHGQRILRCAGGGSFLLTTGSVRTISNASRGGTIFMVAFGAIWNLVIFGVVLFAASTRLVRAVPTFAERLRTE